MAGDTSSRPFSTCMTLFFSLLLFSHLTMAVLEHSFSPKEGAKKRNTIVAASAREGSTAQNPKKVQGETGKSIHAPHQLQGPKRGRSRPPRPPLQWKNRIYNVTAHEVPSGPNPISNRRCGVRIGFLGAPMVHSRIMISNFGIKLRRFRSDNHHKFSFHNLWDETHSTFQTFCPSSTKLTEFDVKCNNVCNAWKDILDHIPSVKNFKPKI